MRSDLCSALETKRIPARIIEPNVEPRLDRNRRLPHSVAKRRMRRQLAGMIETYVRAVMDLAASYDEEAARTLMVRTFGRAMQMGHSLAGVAWLELTDLEVAQVASIAETELGYLREFARSAREDARRTRAQLYGGVVGASLTRGWLAALPATAQIDWVLSVAEHCADCLGLASRSPFNKPGHQPNPLPTVPALGDTRCLGNCKCTLRARSLNFDSTIAAVIGVEINRVGDRPVDPTGPEGRAIAAVYQPMPAVLAYYQRMADIDDERSGVYRQREGEVGREIKQLASRLRHRLRFTANLSEVLDPLDRAKAAGLRFVAPEDLEDDLIGLVAAIVTIDGAERGRVARIQRQPPTVTLDGQRSFRLDVLGRNMLFVENP